MDNTPSKSDMVIFQLKATAFRVKRTFQNVFEPLHKWPPAKIPHHSRLVGESVSELWNEAAPQAEKVLQAGKVQNIRTAIQQIDGCLLPANQTFSFWKQIGRPSRRKGYVIGRELRQGCIIPTIAGGLCQLSNALYDAALKADMVIVERHAHTQNIPGSLTEKKRDATIFWNYVDLRFKTNKDLYIKASMTSDKLIVQLRKVQ